jgi:ribosomal protein S27AE
VNVGTLGMAAIGAKVARSFRKTCPVCGHPMADHLTVDRCFQD